MAKKKSETKKEENVAFDINDKKVTIEKESEKTIDIQAIKNDLNDYLRYKIDKEVAEAIDKSNKKIIRYKNRIILKRDIIIVFLLVVCFFLGFNLYNLSSIKIDIFTKQKSEVTTQKKKAETKEKKEVVSEDDLEEKIKEYGSLIDDIFINDDSDYFDDFYSGNITTEAKLYLSMNKIDDEKVVSEDDSIYIDDSSMKDVYDSSFDSEYEPKSFKYGDYDFKYLKSKEMYLADGEFEKVKSHLVREIIQIDEDDDGVVITTIEGIVKKDKLYTISLKEINDYDGKNLKKYKKNLDKFSYKFVKNDDNYKFLSIEKK